MIRTLFALLVLSTAVNAAEPKVLVGGVPSPRAVAVSADKRIFIAAEQSVLEFKDGKTTEFAGGFQTPKGMIAFQQWLFVADQAGVHRIDLNSKKSTVWVANKDFPEMPKNLRGLTVDERGTVYVSDSELDHTVIYQITTTNRGRNQEPGRKATLLANSKTIPGLRSAGSLLSDSLNHLLVLDSAAGILYRLRMPDLSVEKVADGFHLGGDICTDHYGRLFLSDDLGQQILSIPRPGMKPVVMQKFSHATSNISFDPTSGSLLIPASAEGKVFSLPAQPPGYEVDETPLALEPEVAFQELNWTGWDYGSDSGKVNPLRPLVLTHAGDGSNRIFVATQHGQIHSFKDEPGARNTNVFLDIQSKVLYKDNENEQGLLGLTFHPKYKSNGELFVFYTDKSKRLQNVVSRFRVSKDDPNKVDPNSEEELLRISHKYWNHDGGTICFGPDGYLYIVLGDGGLGGDPDKNGQNKNSILGKILRIDIDHKDSGLAYAIPKDNPFVNQKDARPEIYCLGVRNPWRMSFDRKTGQGWFGEVGQNLWEEINLIEKGGNYGWSIRESLHPFGDKGTGPQPEFIEPIWEYFHTVGKSITGGNVYRGKKLPELDGMYMYADYVSGKLWALKYDFEKKRVVANRPIKDYGSPIMSFGEDEQGEVYMMTFSANGKGIFRFAPKK